jgi:hypothetical protein
MNHATIQREGFTVPLIGIPMSSRIETCDCCHDEFSLDDVRWTGRQMLCKKCDDPVAPSIPKKYARF